MQIHDYGEKSSFYTKKIYDPFLRFLHAWNGLSVFSLILTILFKGFVKNRFPDGKYIIYCFHVYIGYALAFGIAARLIWGIIGPQHAKLKNMFFFKDWLDVLLSRKIKHFESWGHDRYASLAYLLFYILIVYQIISGLIFAARMLGMGPFSYFIAQSKVKDPFVHNLKEIHEIIFYISIFYILIHVTMIFVHEIKNKHPIAQSMFDGLQYKRVKKQDSPDNHTNT